MNIIIFGAGAIGSLFGAMLSKINNVTLIGRKDHVNEIRKNGLKITGKTQLKVKINAYETIDKIKSTPDLIILTVKSYDTENAITRIVKKFGANIMVLSIQNGLDNINKINEYIISDNIFVGITSYGALFSKSGIVKHTGLGDFFIGSLINKNDKLKDIFMLFNQSGIKIRLCSNILKEMWIKGIINSSINPLTSFFQCKNGYLLENLVLHKIVEQICIESTYIANAAGYNFTNKDMIERTKKVIIKTSENYSSMLQSIKKGKKTEIDSINGELIRIGKNNGLNTIYNEILIYSIKSIIKDS
jgi:2-dehydropantoate 2-reductase